MFIPLSTETIKSIGTVLNFGLDSSRIPQHRLSLKNFFFNKSKLISNFLKAKIS